MLNIETLLAFSDNYIWLIHDELETWVVDPGDAQVVIAALERIDRPLTGILLTHHHFDHVGGVEDLVHIYKPRVIAPHNPAIQHVDQRVGQGDSVTAAGLRFTVMEVPGHTLDHIAYFTSDHQPPLLFCGDTLFAGGCGRIFEGTPGMMHQSLQQLTRLPVDTRVYCAHEYTLANLSFATAVEPGNTALQQRVEHDQGARQQQRPTVPSSLSIELDTNPFLRCTERAVVDAAEQRAGTPLHDVDAVFAEIREWKNNF